MRFIWSLVFAVWCLHCLAADAPPPSPPRLLLNTNGLTELKARIAAAPWAAAAWKELATNADQQLTQSVLLPPRGGNWSHHYVCPEHGAHLTQGRKIGPWQWEHICPIGNHILKGDPSKASLDFDGNVIRGILEDYALEIIDHGLVFQVTGDERHARKAREILLAFADRYLTYPIHDNNGGTNHGGHVASQSLTEATWLVSVAQGADLVWSTLSEADRHAIADKILHPALDEVILPDHHGIHNIQCRLNSAIGLVGFLLNDQKLIDTAIDGPSGFRAQLEQGVRADGMWLEGSSGYHFFTIGGLWPLAEAARNNGVDLYTPKFKSMFDGPLKLAMPNFTLPDFNDSGTVPLQGEAEFYELAFARFHDPAYVPILQRSRRRGHLALLFGETNLAVASETRSNKPPATTSRNSPASGYAILQQGSDPTWLCLKYGAHGGGHGHPDKNHFILYAHGRILAPDGGVHAYGSPLHAGWDKTTFAHNTLIVDETSQQPAEGKSLFFGTERGVDYSVTDAGPIYPGVKFTRTAALLSPYLIVFIDQIQADAPHTLDLAYHQFGTWEDLPEGDPWHPPAAPGYKYLLQATTRSNLADCLVFKTTVTNDWQTEITLAGSPDPTAAISGYGILKTTEDRVPLLIQRRHTQRTAFIWAVSVDGSPISLKLTDVKDSEDHVLAPDEAACVEVNNGKRQWFLLANPHKHDLLAALPDDVSWHTTKAFGARFFDPEQ